MEYRSLSTQEVRTADNVVAIPAGTRHPTVQQPELCALHYLGLSYPFPGCPHAGACADPRSCFKCHQTASVDMQTYGCRGTFRTSLEELVRLLEDQTRSSSHETRWESFCSCHTRLCTLSRMVSFERQRPRCGTAKKGGRLLHVVGWAAVSA